MKLILLFYIFLCSTISFASSKADYLISEGRLHKGGTAIIEVIENSDENFTVKMSYQLLRKILVPIPNSVLKGETSIVLPSEFSDERGYLELETRGSMDIKDARIQFLNKVDFRGLKGAYRILVLPKNGKAKIEIIYHSSLPATGWGKILITFTSAIPVLNGYKIQTELN